MSKKRLYIAYGSNLNLTQMAHRCPTAKPVGTAAIKGYELLFRGDEYRGVATIEPREGSTVPVLLWDIKQKDETALDRYEGYPSLYGKQMMDVELDGKPVSAMVYVMTPGHGIGYPSQHYLDIIADGYMSAGFDPSILDAAIRRTDEIIAQELEELATEYDYEQGYGQGPLYDLHWW